jgi:hypothetical protein
MINPPTIWQIAAGDARRTYPDVFIKHGVGLIGPGDAGPWTPERLDQEYEGGQVRIFASEVKLGDVFLLRQGTSKVLAVGIVASDYLHLPQFDDVNGWPLQNARRVRWFRLPQEHDFGRKVFGSIPSRFSRSGDPAVVEFAQRFINSPPTDWQTAPLPLLPPEEPMLDDVPERIGGVVGLARDWAALPYWDPQAFGERPTEDEIVVHFVVPFLQSLGWPPELIAIEWRDIDVSLFSALPRTAENCCMVLEAKYLGSGVEGAVGQAKGYIQAIGGRPESIKVIVTDGLRYRLYEYDGVNEYASVAYANLLRLKRPALELFEHIRRR